MKTLEIVCAIVALMTISFVGGAFFEYTAERQEIAELEQVASESCAVRIRAIQKLCK